MIIKLGQPERPKSHLLIFPPACSLQLTLIMLGRFETEGGADLSGQGIYFYSWVGSVHLLNLESKFWVSETSCKLITEIPVIQAQVVPEMVRPLAIE